MDPIDTVMTAFIASIGALFVLLLFVEYST